MKPYQPWFLCFTLGLSAPGLAQDAAKVTLADDNDKLNYSVGFNVGENLRRQNIEIKDEAFMQGIKDGAASNPTLLTQQEMNAVIAAFQQRALRERAKQHEEKAKKNEEAGAAFLAENAKKEGVVTLPSGLQYKVITKVEKGASPSETDTVKVHYRGTLIDGTEFDSSYARQVPATFALNQVIKGWIEGLKLMKPGEKWQLFIPYNLAYGEDGHPPRIGPKSTLLFDVELLEIVNSAK